MGISGGCLLPRDHQGRSRRSAGPRSTSDQRKVDAQQARRVWTPGRRTRHSPVLWKSIKTPVGGSGANCRAAADHPARGGNRKFARRNTGPSRPIWRRTASFQARLQKLEGHKPEIKTKPPRVPSSRVKKLPSVVTSVSTGERRRKAQAALYDQHDAAGSGQAAETMRPPRNSTRRRVRGSGLDRP